MFWHDLRHHQFNVLNHQLFKHYMQIGYEFKLNEIFEIMFECSM